MDDVVWATHFNEAVDGTDVVESVEGAFKVYSHKNAPSVCHDLVEFVDSGLCGPPFDVGAHFLVVEFGYECKMLDSSVKDGFEEF